MSTSSFLFLQQHNWSSQLVHNKYSNSNQENIQIIKLQKSYHEKKTNQDKNRTIQIANPNSPRFTISKKQKRVPWLIFQHLSKLVSIPIIPLHFPASLFTVSGHATSPRRQQRIGITIIFSVYMIFNLFTNQRRSHHRFMFIHEATINILGIHIHQQPHTHTHTNKHRK